MCDPWMTNSLFSLLQSSPLNLPASSICFLFCWLMLPTDLKYLGILSHVLKVKLLLNKKFFSCRCFARLSPNLENALFSALVTQDGKITLDLMLWCPQARENAKTQMFPTLKNGENASGTGGHRKKKMSIYFFFSGDDGNFVYPCAYCGISSTTIKSIFNIHHICNWTCMFVLPLR